MKQPSGGIILRNFRRGRYSDADLQGICKGKLRKKMSPIRVNGRVLRCNPCRHFRHLVTECPDI